MLAWATRPSGYGLYRIPNANHFWWALLFLFGVLAFIYCLVPQVRVRLLDANLGRGRSTASGARPWEN
jgi:hypothetical protein